MALNKVYFRVNVTDTEKNRNYWASRKGLKPETISDIRAADIILVPWEDRGKADSVSFPGSTTDFFQSLLRELPEKKVVIAIEQDDYCELSLHANEMRWPTLIVSTVFLGAFANVLGAEIEKLINTPSPPATIEMTITVENERGKCISIDYKGPPSRFVDTLVQESERCFPNRVDALLSTPSGGPNGFTSEDEIAE